jgi:hypothetical protein
VRSQRLEGRRKVLRRRSKGMLTYAVASASASLRDTLGSIMQLEGVLLKRRCLSSDG